MYYIEFILLTSDDRDIDIASAITQKPKDQAINALFNTIDKAYLANFTDYQAKNFEDLEQHILEHTEYTLHVIYQQIKEI